MWSGWRFRFPAYRRSRSRWKLQFYAAHSGKGKVRVVGTVFEELSYGIAFQHNSPYREAVNLALLHLIEDGTYKDIHDNWFGAEVE